ncbi:MAG: ribonuclease E/G [Gemmatimonadaceae bacterium]|nr:ribonuclease E/G [Gemmatimonadaceae bacterium]
MKRDILINAAAREVRVAIIEDDQLVELLVERPEARRMVGDIYLGRVEAVQPGLQAAFVDIGTEKSAFLHASDLVYETDDDDDDEDDNDGDDAAEAAQDAAARGSDTPTTGRPPKKEAPQIQDVLKRGDTIIVQVSKEPISTKGPRVTAQVSMAGRFLVYMPFASRVGVSRKIGERAERQRLKQQVAGVSPQGRRRRDRPHRSARMSRRRPSQRELDDADQQRGSGSTRSDSSCAPAQASCIARRSSTRGIIRDLFTTKVDKLDGGHRSRCTTRSWNI